VVLVGGDGEDIARYEPMFKTYSKAVFHLGGLGSGQLAKILTNTLLAAHLGAARDALDAADAFGIDRLQFVDAVVSVIRSKRRTAASLSAMPILIYR
jgi:3-hydroxyisobutyrate dehydrogenase-like beta-hydroxyacid dehydrogenase